MQDSGPEIQIIKHENLYRLIQNQHSEAKNYLNLPPELLCITDISFSHVQSLFLPEHFDFQFRSFPSEQQKLT